MARLAGLSATRRPPAASQADADPGHPAAKGSWYLAANLSRPGNLSWLPKPLFRKPG